MDKLFKRYYIYEIVNICMYVCMYERAAQLVSSAIVPGFFTSHKSFLHPYQAIGTFFYIKLRV